MKSRLFLLLFYLCFIFPQAIVANDNIPYKENKDIIYANRHYREKDSQYAGFGVKNEALSGWYFDEETELVYPLHFPIGYFRTSALITTFEGKSVTLNVSIVDPITKQELFSNKVCAINTNGQKQSVCIISDCYIKEDRWYFFKLSSPDGIEGIKGLDYLEFERTSDDNIIGPEIMLTPAVHLWFKSDDENAPSGECYDWFYHEVMIPKENEYPCTYAMSIGGSGYYMGIQCNRSQLEGYEHAVLFSVWDNGDTDINPNLPSYMRSSVLDNGSTIEINRFGNEGTGAQAFEHNGLWEPSQWVQFLMNARTETTRLSDGTDYPSTLLSVWYKNTDDSVWHYISTTRLSGKAMQLDAWYSFIENYYEAGGEFQRKAYFRNAYAHSLKDNKWIHQNNPTFGLTADQGTGARNSRSDYGRGITDDYDNCFVLMAGGFVPTNDTSNRLPLKYDDLYVDTLNLSPFYDRIFQAYTKENYSLYLEQYNSISTLSDALSMAKTLLDSANQLGGYALKDMKLLSETYYKGNGDDKQKIKDAIYSLISNAVPLKYSIISDLKHLSSSRAYLVGYKQGDDITDLNNNWQIISREQFGSYYFRNIASGKYLMISKDGISLTDEPISIKIDASNNGFILRCGPNTLQTSIIDNHYIKVSEISVEDRPAEPEVVVVEMTTAGTLKDKIDESVQKIAITGPINGTDIAYLRKLINEYYLYSMDLTQAQIVAGGDAYYENYKTTNDIIGRYMFADCSSLVSISLPLSVYAIDQKAFVHCNCLRKIEIPDNVTWLEWDAFAACELLKEATVGKNVYKMGQGIFWTSPIKDVYVKPLVPPSLAAYMFTSNPIIHVSADAYEAYIASDWAQYGTIVGDLESASGILNIEDLAPTIYYDLHGTKIVDPLRNNIYIVNGKKFIYK